MFTVIRLLDINFDKFVLFDKKYRNYQVKYNNIDKKDVKVTFQLLETESKELYKQNKIPKNKKKNKKFLE